LDEELPKRWVGFIQWVEQFIDGRVDTLLDAVFGEVLAFTGDELTHCPELGVVFVKRGNQQLPPAKLTDTPWNPTPDPSKLCNEQVECTTLHRSCLALGPLFEFFDEFELRRGPGVLLDEFVIDSVEVWDVSYQHALQFLGAVLELAVEVV
jgi:hypothetical protein